MPADYVPQQVDAPLELAQHQSVLSILHDDEYPPPPPSTRSSRGGNTIPCFYLRMHACTAAHTGALRTPVHAVPLLM